MNTAYKFRPKQYSDRPSLHLSEKDEYVPATHIGMYSILRDPKNKNVYLDEEHCQKLRSGTYEGLLEIYKKYGSPDLADLFNCSPIDMLADTGLNHFAFHPNIAPVACLIECFETEIKGCLFISFGIDKKRLAEYFKNKDKPGFKAEELRKECENPQSQEKLLFGEEEICLDDHTSVKIERNALYRRFEHWCALQDMDMTTGLFTALQALVEVYPVDGLMELDEYDVITEFDQALFKKPKRREKTIERNMKISGSVYATSNKIIARYNRDPANLARANMSFDDYTNNALHLLNKSMDLKYQDPELYMELRQIERAEEYNDGWGDE